MKLILNLLFVTLLASFTQAKTVEELYEKCANCHGDRGEEKAFGKSKVIANLTEQQIIQALKDYQAGMRDTVGMASIMEGQVYKLSQKDIIDLAKYIKTFK